MVAQTTKPVHLVGVGPDEVIIELRRPAAVDPTTSDPAAHGVLVRAGNFRRFFDGIVIVLLDAPG